MIVLTTPGASRTPTRWRVQSLAADKDEPLCRIEVQLLTTGGMIVSEKTLLVQDGICDTVEMDPSPTRIADTLIHTRAALNLPTGGTAAFDAWRSGGTLAARRSAVETWMLSSGVAKASMAGT